MGVVHGRLPVLVVVDWLISWSVCAHVRVCVGVWSSAQVYYE